MLRVNWPVVDTIHPKSNKYVTGVKIEATVELKLHDSPVDSLSSHFRDLHSLHTSLLKKALRAYLKWTSKVFRHAYLACGKRSNLTLFIPLIKILTLFLHSSDHFSTQNSSFVPTRITKYTHINKKAYQCTCTVIRFETGV